jgi:hypothetical protein
MNKYVKIKTYMKTNPLVFYNHKIDEPPIGVCKKLFIKNDKLQVHIKFDKSFDFDANKHDLSFGCILNDVVYKELVEISVVEKED